MAPPRVSSRLAAKVAPSPISDKENSPQQLSSPPATPAPAKGKSEARQKAKPKASNHIVRGEEKDNTAPATPKSTKKIPRATKNMAQKSKGTDEVKVEEATAPTAKATKRKRASPVPKVEDDEDELPHNMGKRTSTQPKVNEGPEGAKPIARKRKPPASATKQEQDQDAEEIAKGADGPPTKKPRRKANPYGLTPGETPFPDWPHPTEDECRTVHNLLLSTIEPERRKRFVPPDDIPAPSEVVAGCGEVPSILDALIRTLLSAATNGRNSSNAFQGLVQRFGLATVGVGKGSVNWNAVNDASQEEVFEAIKSGGLAKNKSKNIKKILEVVHRENQQRLAALLKAKEAGDLDQLDKDTQAEKELELQTLQQGALTLDYYHVLEKDDAITTFTALPGIGVKTAACVNLFCMQRPCFAVDTHVFRLCQYLGWVPPDDTRLEKAKRADRNTTFSHCEVRIPEELKYGLHQLFLEHGKNCPRCRAITGEKSEGWADANCVIEHLVKRTGAKKGGVESPKKKTKAKKSKDSDDEASEGEDYGQTPRKAASVKKATSTTTPKKVTTPVKATKRAKASNVAKSKVARGKKGAAKVAGSDEEEEEEEEDEDEVMSELTDAAEPSAVEDEEYAEDEE